MMPPKNSFILVFRGAGILLLSLILVSCSALSLSKKDDLPTKAQRERAEKPKTVEVTIPLEKS